MRKTIVWIVVLAALAAIMLPAGCSLLAPATSFKQVDSQGLLDAQAKGAQIVDVRSEGEYKLGHITGSINVPVETVQSAAANWDRSGTYVIYCASGARSADSVKVMQSMGFRQLLELKGGLNGWTGKLVTEDQPAAGVIKTAGKPVMLEFYTDS